LQQWIRDGNVWLDGRSCKPKQRLRGGEQIRVAVVLDPRVESLPQAIPLRILYEDEALLVVDKPPDLVVHPAAGNPDGTLLNALLHHDPQLARLPRAGIVHRLDKDTSGLLVVARSASAHKLLVEQLQARQISREYRALVQGRLVAGGTVDAPVGRHPRHRTRMAVVGHGRPAMTHYRVLERFAAHTWLAVHLETGRTHQIRVHMAHIHHPLVGDRQYAGRPRLPKGADDSLLQALRAFPRQALHACRLALRHPASGEPVVWTSPLPADLSRLLELLRQGAA
jgi:23S rRNA pseudouridine1911/1915/1917 synthase